MQELERDEHGEDVYKRQYVDRAVQKILVDPNADPEKEFADAQKLCETEAPDAFNEANKR